MVVVLLINPLVANAQSKLNAFCIRNKAATVPDCVRLMKKSGYYFLGAETSTSRATCTVGTTPPSGAALKQGSKVYVLGDSITAIAGSSYIAAFSQSGITANVDGSSSRSIVGKGVDGNKLSGLEAVASTEGKAAIASADAIIIALGTNGSNTTKNMADLMAAIRANSKSNVPMYWVDTTVIGKPDYLPVIKATNVAIYAQAQPSALNFTPISWYKTVTPGGDPQEPKATDTDINKYIVQANQFVHPTTAGVAALTSAVVKSVTQPTAATATGTGLSLPTGTEITGNFYGGTKILPPTWIPILNAAGNDVGVDPAFLAAILGNETSWLPPEVFLQNPNHSSHGTISGPFQFAATTAATFKKNLALDGNKDGVVDEKNPFDAAYMAAAYLKSMGASMTIPLGNTGDYAVSRNNSDGKVTVRTVAAHYNQGGGFNAPTAKTAAEVDAKAIGGNIVSKYMDQAQQNTEALRKLEGVGGAVGTGAQCTATASLDFKS